MFKCADILVGNTLNDEIPEVNAGIEEYVVGVCVDLKDSVCFGYFELSGSCGVVRIKAWVYWWYKGIVVIDALVVCG